MGGGGAEIFFNSKGLFLLSDSLFCVFWAEPGFSEKADFLYFFGVVLGFGAIFLFNQAWQWHICSFLLSERGEACGV